MDGFEMLMRALEKEKNKSQLTNQTVEAANDTYNLMKTFIKAGFTEEQAFTIVLEVIRK